MKFGATIPLELSKDKEFLELLRAKGVSHLLD